MRTLHLRSLVAVALALVSIVACAGKATYADFATPPTVAGPVLAPGDLLRINVWQYEELSGDLLIGSDSALVHPLYKSVKVAGLPLSSARERLYGFLTAHRRDPQLVVQLLFTVAVGGEVRSPSLYTVQRGTTLGQVIAQAGGATTLGKLDDVTVVRDGTRRTVDLTSSESQFGAIPLQSGDQVFVGRRGTFNFIRDVFGPLVGATAAIASIINVVELRRDRQTQPQ